MIGKNTNSKTFPEKKSPILSPQSIFNLKFTPSQVTDKTIRQTQKYGKNSPLNNIYNQGLDGIRFAST